MAYQKALERAVAEPVAALGQRLAQLLDGDVRGIRDKLADQRGLRLDACGATVAAQRAWPGIAVFADKRTPAADTRSADTKPRPRSAMAGAG